MMRFVPVLLLSNLMHVFFFVDCSLDYPGVGPEHSYLKDLGRAEYYSVTDDEALEGTGLQNIHFLVSFVARYLIHILKFLFLF